MSDLTIILIGGAMGALAGMASAVFILMPVLRKSSRGASPPIDSSRQETIFRLIGASEVVVFAVVGAYIAYAIFGGAA